MGRAPLRRRSAGLLAGLLLAGCTGSVAPVIPAQPAGTIAIPAGFDAQQYTSLAKVGMAEALALARAKVPGRVAWASLENYDEFLFYSVEVVDAARTVSMVTLDAGSGTVNRIEPVAPKQAAPAKAGDAPADDAGGDGGAPAAAPEVSLVRGTIPAPEGVKDAELPWLTTATIDQALASLARTNPGAFLSVSVYRQDETLLFGLELVQSGNRHVYFYMDPKTGKVLDTTRW